MSELAIGRWYSNVVRQVSCAPKKKAVRPTTTVTAKNEFTYIKGTACDGDETDRGKYVCGRDVDK